MKKISFVKLFNWVQIVVLFGTSIGFYMFLEKENPSVYNLIIFPIFGTFFLIMCLLFPIKPKEKSSGKQ